ncbi:unnamed protein product [Chrysodeixis includens]|uniref:Uncharacterized protein n=1 Tax=Chrysodeixis includens TaxID=689277 RepID=A0A9N8PZX8_CHRIL|nr:unnamed protein product [Chrysodeixis includens]
MVIRASVISSWCLASWFHILVVSSQTDMFYKQLGQTKLICAYVQLKPNTPENIFRLTKTIFDALELRETRVSLYDMFSFDTGFILRIAASTFVYITAQLQLALPNLKEGHYFGKVRYKIKMKTAFAFLVVVAFFAYVSAQDATPPADQASSPTPAPGGM